MRRPRFIVATVCFVLGVALVSGSPVEGVGQEKKPAAAASQKWEYRLVTQTIAESDAQAEERLIKLGEDGFDLVAAISVSSSGGEGRKEVPSARYILKRRK